MTDSCTILDQFFDATRYIDVTREHYHHTEMISHRAAQEGKDFSAIDVILAVLAHDEGLSLFSAAVLLLLTGSCFLSTLNFLNN